MELGVFLAVVSMGALGFWRNRSLMFTGLAVGVFFALAFLLTLGTTVQTTTTSSSYTTTINHYNSTGGFVDNDTITTPERTVTTPIIDGMQIPIAWVFFGAAVFMVFLFIRNISSMAGWSW